jgi:hypothetical protein
MDEHRIMNGNRKLIVAFGGLVPKLGGIPAFEFLRYLSSTYKDVDMIFYFDQHQSWYHRGIGGISTNIKGTVLHLNNLIKGYDKVIFIGVSAGGYAAILFGSLCNVHHVMSFIPQTILDCPRHREFSEYKDLKQVINSTTQYLVYGDTAATGPHHHFRHCANINCFPNVTVIKDVNVAVGKLRDNGVLKQMIDDRLTIL